MGLDNGFILKITANKDFPEIIKKRIDIHAFTDPNCEVIYWRKCYSMREDVLDIIQEPGKPDEFDTRVYPKQIPDIIKALSRYLDPDYWLKNADCIWDYDDLSLSLYYDILILNWLYFYLSENPDKELIFYDSY